MCHTNNTLRQMLHYLFEPCVGIWSHEASILTISVVSPITTEFISPQLILTPTPLAAAHVCVCVFIFIHPPICQNGLSDSIVMHIHYNNVKPQSHTYHSFTEDERVCGVMVLQILSLQRGDIHVQCYFVLFPESELYLFVSAHFGLIYWTSLEKAGLPIRLRNANKNFGRIYICF